MPNRRTSINDKLFVAVKANDTSAVSALLKEGANPNAEESFLFRGYQPYSRPVLHALLRATDERGFGVEVPENLEILVALLDAGAEPNGRDTDLFTPLRLAVLRPKWLKTICLLLDRGAEINAADHQGQTPLLVASFGINGISVMKELLERGAFVDAQSDFGSTALMYAVDGSILENVRLLLEFGANPHLKDKHGRTALDFINERTGDAERLELMELLSGVPKMPLEYR